MSPFENNHFQTIFYIYDNVGKSLNFRNIEKCDSPNPLTIFHSLVICFYMNNNSKLHYLNCSAHLVETV